ncbi:MAG TPA: DUF4936 family protein [Caldimonas sp.]
MRELFVYYRVPAAQAAAAEAEVRALQADLRAAMTGLRTRLLRRPEESGVQQTWMEIYAFDAAQEPAGVSPELQAEIEAEASRRLTRIEGPRHVEVFIPLAS